MFNRTVNKSCIRVIFRLLEPLANDKSVFALHFQALQPLATPPHVTRNGRKTPYGNAKKHFEAISHKGCRGSSGKANHTNIPRESTRSHRLKMGVASHFLQCMYQSFSGKVKTEEFVLHHQRSLALESASEERAAVRTSCTFASACDRM